MRPALPYLLSVGLLAGCATSSPEQIAASARPATSTEKQLILDGMRTVLKDPYSVRDAQITSVVKLGYNDVVCVRGNAKNSFGAYEGITTMMVYFLDGRIVKTSQDMFAQNDCARLSWHPFPEVSSLKAL